MIAETATAIVEFVHSLGYLGLFIATFLESTFIPIPSAATMIPAGYLAHEGQWSLLAVWLIAISGTITGSLANYGIAYYLGRPFLARYGDYMFFGADKQQKLDAYFARHGEISIFTARLIPGVRHVISFPAGLARMNVAKFCLLTGAGGGLWMTTLMLVGYFIGGNKDLVHAYMPYITGAFITGVIGMVAFYIWQHRRKAVANVGN